MGDEFVPQTKSARTMSGNEVKLVGLPIKNFQMTKKSKLFSLRKLESFVDAKANSIEHFKKKAVKKTEERKRLNRCTNTFILNTILRSIKNQEERDAVFQQFT